MNVYQMEAPQSSRILTMPGVHLAPLGGLRPGGLTTASWMETAHNSAMSAGDFSVDRVRGMRYTESGREWPEWDSSSASGGLKGGILRGGQEE